MEPLLVAARGFEPSAPITKISALPLRSETKVSSVAETPGTPTKAATTSSAMRLPILPGSAVTGWR